MTLRVIVLAAVSTPQQAGAYRQRKRAATSKRAQAADDKYSIDTQLELCRRLAAGHPTWQIAAEVVIPGHTRRYDWLHELAADCAEYAGLLERIKAREADGLLVAYDDRAFRGVTLAGQLAVFCAQYGCQVRAADSFQEFQDPGEFELTPFDKLMFSFRGYAAESYADAFWKKARPGIEARVAKKHLHMCSTPPWCYGPAPDADSPTPQVLEEVAWARRMRDWRVDERWGWNRIADELERLGCRTRAGNAWGPVVVRDLLTNAYLAGYVAWGAIGAGQSIRGQHEPVWTPDEWERLQAVNALMATRYVPRQEHEFSGLCECGICEAQGLRRSMVYYRKRRRGGGYREALYCAEYNRPEAVRHEIERHRNGHSVATLRHYVIWRLQEELRDPAAFLSRRAGEAEDGANGRMAALEAALRDADRMWRRWSQAYEAEVIDALELGEHRAEIEARRREIEAELRQLRARQSARAAAEAGLQQLAGSPQDLAALLEALPRLDWQARRRAYLLLMRRIVLMQGQEPRIEWWA